MPTMFGGKKVEAAISTAVSSGIPKEFLCAINGHVMKEPVRAMASNLTFEKVGLN